MDNVIKLSGGKTEIIYDGDTDETIYQKFLDSVYIIDLRSEISVPLESIIQEQKRKQQFNSVPKFKIGM